MSNQPSSSCQPTTTPSQDWTQVPDADLKVHTSNSEGTEQAKEAKKSRHKAVRKERAEEAWLERECLEWEECEKQEQEEHERWECKECEEKERWEALSVMKGKGRVGGLQSESRGHWWAALGSDETDEVGLRMD
ncbi:hypothetical protein EDD16DRAFT_1517735 [Pisolithus croceorrhizus]|nr:hypothetical protein EDD16DRAFT_1517735 [Pisolithus croceorrhizus]